MRTGMADVLRSLLFYVAFYGGTLPYIAVAFVSLSLGPAAFRRVVASWSRYHRACARRLLGIELVVEGTIPEGGALIAVKHESFFEAIDTPALLDCPVVFAKAELLRIPLWGRLATNFGVIPVARERGASALRSMISAARKHAREGRMLVIFPEGTRVPHGRPAPLRPGFVGLYKLLGLPIIPVAVDSGRLYHRRWKRSGTITARIGEPIPPGLPREDIERRVKEAINALNRPAEEASSVSE